MNYILTKLEIVKTLAQCILKEIIYCKRCGTVPKRITVSFFGSLGRNDDVLYDDNGSDMTCGQDYYITVSLFLLLIFEIPSKRAH